MAPHVVEPLTADERELLRIMARAYEVMREPPSQRALSRRLSISLPALQARLVRLCRKGWLRVPDPSGLRCLHVPEGEK